MKLNGYIRFSSNSNADLNDLLLITYEFSLTNIQQNGGSSHRLSEFSELNFSLSFNAFCLQFASVLKSFLFFHLSRFDSEVLTPVTVQAHEVIRFHFYILSSLCSHIEITVYFDSNVPEKPSSSFH